MLTGNLHFSRHGTDPSHVRVSSGPAFLATACRQAARLERLRAAGTRAQDLLELAGTPARSQLIDIRGRARRAQTEAGAIEQSATNLHAQGKAGAGPGGPRPPRSLACNASSSSSASWLSADPHWSIQHHSRVRHRVPCREERTRRKRRPPLTRFPLSRSSLVAVVDGANHGRSRLQGLRKTASTQCRQPGIVVHAAGPAYSRTQRSNDPSAALDTGWGQEHDPHPGAR